MKTKLFLFIAIITSELCQAQITLENSYQATSQSNQFSIVYFNSGYKYQLIDMKNANIKFYNLNHSLYKSISLPIPSGFNIYTYGNISEQLFDTDPNIELSYTYWGLTTTVTPATYTFVTKIIKDDGTVLLTIPQCQFAYAVNTGTANGWKLLATIDSVNKSSNEKFSVYSLVGSLPIITNPNELTNISSNKIANTPNISSPIPNPSNGKTVIGYQLVPGQTIGEIAIYDVSGKEIKRYQVDSNFNTLELDNSDLPSGTYFYDMVSTGGKSTAKKMVIIK